MIYSRSIGPYLLTQINTDSFIDREHLQPSILSLTGVLYSTNSGSDAGGRDSETDRDAPESRESGESPAPEETVSALESSTG